MKSIDYLIYSDVHETFTGKIMFEFGNKNEKICVSNYVWCQTFFGLATTKLNGE